MHAAPQWRRAMYIIKLLHANDVSPFDKAILAVPVQGDGMRWVEVVESRGRVKGIWRGSKIREEKICSIAVGEGRKWTPKVASFVHLTTNYLFHTIHIDTNKFCYFTPYRLPIPMYWLQGRLKIPRAVFN